MTIGPVVGVTVNRPALGPERDQVRVGVPVATKTWETVEPAVVIKAIGAPLFVVIVGATAPEPVVTWRTCAVQAPRHALLRSMHRAQRR